MPTGGRGTPRGLPGKRVRAAPPLVVRAVGCSVHPHHRASPIQHCWTRTWAAGGPAGGPTEAATAGPTSRRSRPGQPRPTGTGTPARPPFFGSTKVTAQRAAGQHAAGEGRRVQAAREAGGRPGPGPVGCCPAGPRRLSCNVVRPPPGSAPGSQSAPAGRAAGPARAFGEDRALCPGRASGEPAPRVLLTASGLPHP